MWNYIKCVRVLPFLILGITWFGCAEEEKKMNVYLDAQVTGEQQDLDTSVTVTHLKSVNDFMLLNYKITTRDGKRYPIKGLSLGPSKQGHSFGFWVDSSMISISEKEITCEFDFTVNRVRRILSSTFIRSPKNAKIWRPDHERLKIREIE